MQKVACQWGPTKSVPKSFFLNGPKVILMFNYMKSTLEIPVQLAEFMIMIRKLWHEIKFTKFYFFFTTVIQKYNQGYKYHRKVENLFW